MDQDKINELLSGPRTWAAQQKLHDNPFIDSDYLTRMKREMEETMKAKERKEIERRIYGQWEDREKSRDRYQEQCITDIYQRLHMLEERMVRLENRWSGVEGFSLLGEA